MTKPHEETWDVYVPREEDTDAGTAYVSDAATLLLIATVMEPVGGTLPERERAAAERAAFIAQAPAMARLLLKLQWSGEEGCSSCGYREHGQQSFTSPVASLHYALDYPPGTHSPDCELATVLRAAGVLP